MQPDFYTKIERLIMNYFELINKCLTELNYKNVNVFSELIKNEHTKIKNILNTLNAEICLSENWPFLIKKVETLLPRCQGTLENPADGRIFALKIDGKTYKYIPDFECFFTNSQSPETYSTINNTILLPQFEKDKIVEIHYYSKDCVKSADGNFKTYLEYTDDETVIPMPYAEPLLVYGSCMRLKGNPQHIRFNFWLSMYNSALANLRAHCIPSVDYIPEIKMDRGR